MISDIKFVVCDIDNTLISYNTPMTQRTENAMLRLYEHGVNIGIASGRPLKEIDYRIKDWNFLSAIKLRICMNGSEMWDDIRKKEYGFFKLQPDTLKTLVEMLLPFDVVIYVYDSDANFLCSRDNSLIRTSAERNGRKLRVAKDISELYEKENSKLMIRFSEDNMPDFDTFLKNNTSPDYHGFRTQPTLFEFTDRRVSKGFALKKFCEESGVSINSIMAFGDTSNDNEMLKESGWGVCLANGTSDTKSIADEVTEKTCDEAGFADYIENKILIPRGWM